MSTRDVHFFFFSCCRRTMRVNSEASFQFHSVFPRARATREFTLHNEAEGFILIPRHLNTPATRVSLKWSTVCGVCVCVHNRNLSSHPLENPHFTFYNVLKHRATPITYTRIQHTCGVYFSPGIVMCMMNRVVWYKN